MAAVAAVVLGVDAGDLGRILWAAGAAGVADAATGAVVEDADDDRVGDKLGEIGGCGPTERK